jgi:hypothetical protein
VNDELERVWKDVKVTPNTRLNTMREIMTYFAESRKFSGRECNPKPLKYEAGVIIL